MDTSDSDFVPPFKGGFFRFVIDALKKTAESYRQVKYAFEYACKTGFMHEWHLFDEYCA